MNEQPTCGQGLAEHAALPAKMAELLAALADNLALHMKALGKDRNARVEHEAYERLTKAYREIAADLERTAREMLGYRDIPMGAHDEKALASPMVRKAFESYLETEKELLALLHESIERDSAMLG